MREMNKQKKSAAGATKYAGVDVRNRMPEGHPEGAKYAGAAFARARSTRERWGR